MAEVDAVTDLVSIRGLVVSTVIGVYEWERSVTQDLVVCVDMAADVRAASASDDIADALDYSAVAGTIRSVLVDGKFQLIETAASRVASAILDGYGVGWVRVEIVKPLPKEGYSAAVTVERGARSAAGGSVQGEGRG